jgi:hypothetical protein
MIHAFINTLFEVATEKKGINLSNRIDVERPSSFSNRIDVERPSSFNFDCPTAFMSWNLEEGSVATYGFDFLFSRSRFDRRFGFVSIFVTFFIQRPRTSKPTLFLLLRSLR